MNNESATLNKETKVSNEKGVSKNQSMNKPKVDFIASGIIGVLASLFSLIVIKNLGINISILIPFLIFIPICVIGIAIARALADKIPALYQFGKFGETGGLNWLFDFGVLNLLIMISGISTGIYFSLFKGISFIASVTNSYAWNKFWVFRKTEKESEKETAQEISKFMIVSLVGMAVNVILASAIVFIAPKIILSNIAPKVWANLAAAIGSVSAMMWNFVGYKFFVFKK
ncbi:hypothetical protein COS74_00650 [bacterium CG06_land_8_20_14_3_00_33_50]|nr:MAG: hypothetical protein COU50_00475 [bacterium CG10_big_fil_rev_8_21_14_0_10_33_18]PIU77097.1 MAG: hypothetical protein COS74_00650 [bacterium CG06_land_8_20_14_3_00_33_50]PIW81194.1 MAG: hypothetical protein COZ97_03110 [bacterium CG_4_8_14_3_um_filter_33_28]